MLSALTCVGPNSSAAISDFRSVISNLPAQHKAAQPNRHHLCHPGPLHRSRHPEVLLLSRGRFPEGPRNGTPRVYSVRRRFPAPAHGTQEARLLCGVLPAISTFQRHITQHPSIHACDHFRPAPSPILLLQEVPFSCQLCSTHWV
jgi:hypothetical protein